MIFGSKAPFADRVRKTHAHEIDAHLSPPPENSEVLGQIIAILTMRSARLVIEGGAPKINGRKMSADVFAWEICMFAGNTIREHYVAITGEPETAFMRSKFVQAHMVIAKTADHLCGWDTGAAAKARLMEYRSPDADGMNLFANLMSAGSATAPIEQYTSPMHLGFDATLMSKIVGLTAVSQSFAEAVSGIVDRFGFDAERI